MCELNNILTFHDTLMDLELTGSARRSRGAPSGAEIKTKICQFIELFFMST